MSFLTRKRSDHVKSRINSDARHTRLQAECRRQFPGLTSRNKERNFFPDYLLLVEMQSRLAGKQSTPDTPAFVEPAQI